MFKGSICFKIHIQIQKSIEFEKVVNSFLKYTREIVFPDFILLKYAYKREYQQNLEKKYSNTVLKYTY